MANETASQTYSLQLKRTFPAPREKVWKAWTTPEALKRWFAPSDEYSTPTAQVDLRVGGGYRIEIYAPDGTPHIVVGNYEEIQAPEKLVFTLSWEGGPVQNTRVTVDFHEQGEETEEGIVIKKRPTHQVLASMAGTARETVTRVMRRLADEGYIRTDGRQLVILKQGRNGIESEFG